MPPATHYDLWPLMHAPLCHLRATATTSSQKTLTNTGEWTYRAPPGSSRTSGGTALPPATPVGQTQGPKPSAVPPHFQPPCRGLPLRGPAPKLRQILLEALCRPPGGRPAAGLSSATALTIFSRWELRGEIHKSTNCLTPQSRRNDTRINPSSSHPGKLFVPGGHRTHHGRSAPSCLAHS